MQHNAGLADLKKSIFQLGLHGAKHCLCCAGWIQVGFCRNRKGMVVIAYGVNIV